MRYYSSTAGAMTLTAGVGAGATTLAVDTVVGLPVSYPYTLVIEPGVGGQEEIVTVTAAAGTNLTVTRGEDSTTGVTHALGAPVRHMMTARDLRESREHEALVADVHGTDGSLVGTESVQSLDNKTFQATVDDHTPLILRDAATQTTPVMAVKTSAGTTTWSFGSAEIGSDAVKIRTSGATTLFGEAIEVLPSSTKDGVVVNHATGSSGYAFKGQKAGVNKSLIDIDGNATFSGTLAVTGAATLSSTLAVTGAITSPTITDLVAADAALDVRVDALEAGTWTTFAPELTSSGTAPTVPSARQCRYRVQGKSAEFQMSLTLAAGAGTGAYVISLPFTAASFSFDQTVTVGFFDASTGRHYIGRGLVNPGSATIVRSHIEGGVTLGATTPVTPAAGDIIYAAGTIEVA